MFAKKNNSPLTAFFSFLSKNWVMILGAIFVVPFIVRYVKEQKLQLEKQNLNIAAQNTFIKNVNPITQQNAADKITRSKSLQAAANSLANDLGTKFLSGDKWSDIFETKTYTENDANVAKTLIYQRKNYALLVKLYYTCYTAQRNLTNDVLKYLDAAELLKVRKYLNI